METRVATPLSRPVPLSRMLVGGDLLGRNQWGAQVESQNAARGVWRQPMGVEDALGHRKGKHHADPRGAPRLSGSVPVLFQGSGQACSSVCFQQA